MKMEHYSSKSNGRAIRLQRTLRGRKNKIWRSSMRSRITTKRLEAAQTLIQKLMAREKVKAKEEERVKERASAHSLRRLRLQPQRPKEGDERNGPMARIPEPLLSM